MTDSSNFEMDQQEIRIGLIMPYVLSPFSYLGSVPRSAKAVVKHTLDATGRHVVLPRVVSAFSTIARVIVLIVVVDPTVGIKCALVHCDDAIDIFGNRNGWRPLPRLLRVDRQGLWSSISLLWHSTGTVGLV